MWQIYLITNLINHKRYVGETSKGYLARFQEHLTMQEDKKSALHYAIDQYGVASFKIEVLEDNIPNQAEARRKETAYIKMLKTVSRTKDHWGYNIKVNNGGREIINGYRVCSRCHQNHPITFYYQDRSKQYGFTEKCKACSKEQDQKKDRVRKSERAKKNYQNNSNKIKKQVKNYRENNKEEIAARKREKYLSRRDEILSNKKATYHQNKDQINAKRRAKRKARLITTD